MSMADGVASKSSVCPYLQNDLNVCDSLDTLIETPVAMCICTCVPVFSNVYIYWSANQVASAVDVHVKHQNERISLILSSLVSTGVEPREPPSGFITMWLLTCLSAHHRGKSYLDSWVPIIHPVKTSNQFWPFSSSRRFHPQNCSSDCCVQKNPWRSAVSELHTSAFTEIRLFPSPRWALYLSVGYYTLCCCNTIGWLNHHLHPFPVHMNLLLCICWY